MSKHCPNCDSIRIGGAHGSEPWRCRECGKTFLSGGAIEREELKDSGYIMPSLYECRKMGIEKCQTQGSDHYKEGGIEPLDLIIVKGMAEDFCIGNMVKYAIRFKKTQNIDDLKKVADYAHILCGVKVIESELRKV